MGAEQSFKIHYIMPKSDPKPGKAQAGLIKAPGNFKETVTSTMFSSYILIKAIQDYCLGVVPEKDPSVSDS